MREEERDKVLFPGFLFGLLITLFNVYFYAILFFKGIGLSHPATDRVMLSFYEAGFFEQYYVTKALATLFLVMTFIMRNGISMEVSWKRCWIVTGIGLVSFFLPPQIGDLPYIISSIIGFVVLSRGVRMIAGKFSSYKAKTNDPYETFQQNEKYIPADLNFRMKYYWKGKWRKGWINLIEQRRHTFVCGIPGSGKSFSIIEEQLIQDIEHGYSMFVYDFKFPDLSTLVYNVFMKNRKVYVDKYGPGNDDPESTFVVVNFKDPRYSDRCNPLDPMYIRTFSDAMEAAETILNDLNPNKDKGDKFFDGSAKVYIAALIWLLRGYEDGMYCSFPHLIELVSYDYKKVLELAKTDSQAKAVLQSFIDADAKKAEGQIMGQIASARIPLMNMVDSHLYWVMQVNDIPLDLNNISHPKVMCIGNVPDKVKVTSTAISLIASRMFKEVNMFKGAPLNINIDECTTFHATGMDTTMATCRSKDIGFTIAVQDPNQMFRDWGEKEGKSIMGLLGNQFFGQSLGDYNRHISEMLGKEYRVHQSLSNGESDSVSTSYQLEERASIKNLAELSQGQFIGFAADNVTHPNTLKQFNCFIQSDIEKRKEYAKVTKGIPKRKKMEVHFNDKVIEDECRQDPEGTLKGYLYDEIRKRENTEKNKNPYYNKMPDNMIRREMEQKYAAMSKDERKKLLEDVIKKRQDEDMEAILEENMLNIRGNIKSMMIARGVEQPDYRSYGKVPGFNKSSKKTIPEEGGFNN